MNRLLYSIKGRKVRRKILVVLVAVLVGFFLAEMAVRIGSPDWRIIKRMLGYQNVDTASHEPVLDSEIIYRLKPGFADYGGHQVTINSLRFRGPEITEKKPDGVFRILCVGGSNVFGLGLNDDETWPAQLEQELNVSGAVRFELLNAGACAYVPVQMIAVAGQAIENNDPDLVIFALSNGGARPFLYDAPVEPYFDEFPTMWNEFFTEDCLTRPAFLPYEARLWLTKHLRLYRFVAASLASQKDRCTWWENFSHEKLNARATVEFIRSTKRTTKICIFIYPGASKNEFLRYYKDAYVPVLALNADGLGPEYKNIHPPAYVTQWYGREIAKWLRDKGLVPE